MKATKVVKDKLKLTAVLNYKFTDDTDAEVLDSFTAMLKDLCFNDETPEANTRFMSVEYLDDLKNIKEDLKAWIKENFDRVGAGSTITFYYTKPERGYVKARVYTFE